MAIVANTYTRYDAKGLREQLADIIYDISPTDTPVVSAAFKGDVDQTLYEWQTDSLAATDTGNAHLEGDDITSFPAVVATARVGNYTQISRKLLIVSGTLDAVDKAGRQTELQYQVARRGRELKRDMEAIILSNQGGDAGGTSTARQTATLGAWLKSNTDFGSGGADPTYTSGVPGDARTDGTQRALTETIFKSVIQSMWSNGANIDAMTVYSGPHNKEVISSFDGVATKNFDLSGSPRPTAVIAAADVYVSDFGTVHIMPNRFQRDRDVWFIDPEFVGVVHLRPFRVEELAKTGDAKKRMLLQEWGLRVNQEAALGGIFDLSTS